MLKRPCIICKTFDRVGHELICHLVGCKSRLQAIPKSELDRIGAAEGLAELRARPSQQPRDIYRDVLEEDLPKAYAPPRDLRGSEG
jgi:hypothetical protein